MKSILQGAEEPIQLERYDYAVLSCTSGDFKFYDQYKRGQIGELDFLQGISIETLIMLEKLGYPMDKTGTFLYKDLIVELFDKLISSSEDKTEELQEQLKNPYGQLYFEVARNDHDLGTTTFHRCVHNAINEINYEAMDVELYETLYKEVDLNSITYGENALLIASHLNKHYRSVLQMNQTSEKILRPNT